MATVLLVRHGETMWNRRDRVQGWAPTRLTDRGREQAAALGSFLAAEYDVDRLHASDLPRARETAEQVTRSTGLGVTPESAWRERDFGHLQGLTKATLDERHPRFRVGQVGRSAVEALPDSGERLLDMRDRVLTRWRRLVTDVGEGETVAVVAHGGPLHAVVGDAKDLDLVPTFRDQVQDNCGVNEFRVDAGAADDPADDATPDPAGDDATGDRRVTLVRENATPFLPP